MVDFVKESKRVIKEMLYETGEDRGEIQEAVHLTIDGHLEKEREAAILQLWTGARFLKMEETKNSMINVYDFILQTIQDYRKLKHQPSSTYSRLHMMTLGIDGWIHESGLKGITISGLDTEKKSRGIEDLLNGCYDMLKPYKPIREIKHASEMPDAFVKGDITYALRIAAKLAGSENNFAFDDIKAVAEEYNGKVTRGSKIQRIQVEYIKEGGVKREYISLNKNELILKEVI